MIIKGYAGKQLFPKHTDNQIGFKIYSFMPNNEYISSLSLNDYGNITIKGELPSLFNDKEYEFDVEFEVKNNYESYIVKRILSNPMEMNDKQSFNFLSELLGEKLAYNIIDVYPDFVKTIMSGNIESIDVSKVKGLGNKKLQYVEAKIKENICFFKIIGEFKEYEFTMNQVKNLYEAYSSFELLKKKIEENPYKCLCSIAGIGFKKADKLILNKNRQLATSMFRMAECVLYELGENENSGNTWTTTGELYSNCSNITPECINEFKKVITTNSRIYYDEENKRVAKKQTYNYEKEISEKIKNMIENNKKLEWNGCVYDDVDGFKLSEEQVQIQRVIIENNVAILAGSGGTGKSFSTRAVCDMLDDLNMRYILLAPTGKASKNLADNTKRSASTIHRGLCYKPPEGFQYNEEHKLTCDIVIVDEATMIDIKLMVALLRAIDDKTKLLFICDPAQISSIGAGNCMQDLINEIPTVTLTKVFRYEDGGMAKVATDTRNGKKFLNGDNIQKFGSDFCFVSASKDNMNEKVLSAYKKMMNLGGTVDTISIISAYNKGEFGTYNINKIIQDYVNPSNNNLEMSYTREKQEITFRVNDRVMQTVNNYSAEMCELTVDNEWVQNGLECSIFNGDDGKIVDIRELKNGTKIMIVDFYGNYVLYKGDAIRSLLLGYSISAHKSQGSSIPYVITITPPPHKFFLNRNLLYVMYSRARKFIYSIGTIDTIESALKKSENLSRRTFLKEMITK